MSEAYELVPEKKVGSVLDALAEAYGPHEKPPRDPLRVLVRGILSQNTSDVNSGRAFDSLMEEFGDWEGIAAASEDAIAEAIRSGGLAEQKAATIRAAMDWLTEEGEYSLDFLKSQSSEEIEDRLTALKGVGIKTARLVLLFGFDRPIFVVDTHVHRVSRRLGLTPPKCTRQKAHHLLNDLVPDGRKYAGHLNMIEHGRQTCKSQRPLCDACCVREWCLYVRGELD